MADQLDRRRSGLPRVTCKRNCPDASLPLELSRPGVLLNGGGAVLLQGEEKPWVPTDTFYYPCARSEAWSMVTEELMAKPRDRNNYNINTIQCCRRRGALLSLHRMPGQVCTLVRKHLTPGTPCRHVKA